MTPDTKIKLLDALGSLTKAVGALAQRGFCPTGQGGGVDPSCGSGSGAGGGGLSADVAKERKTLAKIMPSGSKPTFGGSGVKWEKRGGQAGKKILAKLEEKALAAGFTQKDRSSGASPDGSYVGSGKLFTHPNGHSLRTDRSFGATAAQNWYTAELTYAPVT